MEEVGDGLLGDVLNVAHAGRGGESAELAPVVDARLAPGHPGADPGLDGLVPRDPRPIGLCRPGQLEVGVLAFPIEEQLELVGVGLGDPIGQEFKLSDVAADLAPDTKLHDLWDFGPWIDKENNPSTHCSYAYHWPIDQYALTVASDPAKAVAADRNPWMEPNKRSDNDWSDFQTGVLQDITEDKKKGNTIVHQDEGQNVLFLDGHVTFEKYPTCGIEDDNIYTRRNWGGGQIGEPTYGAPANKKDSYLINNRAYE